MRVNGRAVLATLVLVLVSVSAVTFSYATLYPSLATDALGNSGSAEIGLNVKEFIKLAVDTNNLALKDEDNNTIITPTTSGTLISGDVNLAVTTNTEKGYSLSVYTADNTKAMSHSNSGIEASIAPVDTAPGYNATNGISTLANNTWGFRKLLDTNTNTGEKTYSNWYSIGSNSTNGTIIDSTDSDDSLYCDNLAYPLENTGCSASSYNTYEVNFGAKLTNSLPAGTYANDVVFSAVAKSEGIKYRLIFNPNPTGANGGSNPSNNSNNTGGITGSMSPKTILAGSTTTLPKGTFEKEGKGIKGWALVDNATLSTTPIYDINSTVQVDTILADAETAGQTPDTNNNEINLYAVWDTAYTLEFQYGAEDVEGTPFTGTTIKSNNLTFPEYTAFSKEGYTQIGWALVENATAETTPLFEENQTISISNLITAAQNAGQSVSPTTAGKIVLYGVWEKNKVYFQTENSCATIPGGETSILRDSRDNQDYTVYRFPNTNTDSVDYLTSLAGMCIMTQDLALGYVTGGSITAGSNLALTRNDSAAAATVKGDWTSNGSQPYYYNGPDSDNNDATKHSYYNFTAAQSVCPKGWRVPTNTEYDNFIRIIGNGNSEGSLAARSEPYNFNYGGMITNNLSNVNTMGYYWTSSLNGSSSAFGFELSSSNIRTITNAYRYYGYSVRCVAEYLDGTMQNFDTSTIEPGQVVKLKDIRDNSIYTVKKFEYGSNTKTWMISNLKLGYDKGYALTKENTNIPDDTTYYLPKAGRKGPVTDPNTISNSNTSTPTFDSFSGDAEVQYNTYYKPGNTYYNFNAATLGYSTSSGGAGEATRDICPAGWKIPTSTEWNWLGWALGNFDRNEFTKRGLFELVSYYSDGELKTDYSYGCWWSSTVTDSRYARALTMGTNNAPQDYYQNLRYLGYTVRCVAK